MAAKNTYPTSASSPALTWMVGSFLCNGTSAPSSLRGAKYTVARDGVGTYTVTFSEKYTRVYSALVGTEENSSGESHTAYPKSAGNTALVLETQTTPGTVGDLTAVRVHFTIAMANTGQVK